MLHWFRSSIKAKITLLVLFTTSIVLAIVLGFTGIFSRSVVQSDARSYALGVAEVTAGRLAKELSSVAMVTRNLAYAIGYGQWDKRSIDELLMTIVKSNEDIYGSTVSFVPFGFDPALKAYAPYYYKKNGMISFVQLADSYDYFNRDWFKKPLETGKPTWSNPYFDEGGGETLMITYSYPFMEKNLEPINQMFKGVITADISLDHLTDMVSGIKIEETGYAFLLSDKGDLIVWPQKDLIMKETIFSLADKLGDSELRNVGEEMLKQGSGFLDAGLSLTEKESFLAFSSLPDFGWRLGVVIPKHELFAQTYALEKILLILGVAGILLLSTVSLMVARSVSAPLKRMAHVTEKVGEGHFDVDFTEKTRLDEVGQLARSFMSMSKSLRSYMKDLTQATANKERIESELRIAADIQKSMLPSSFPAFPNRNDFDIYALMRPAKEVGGDFFDFFLLDDDHLCVSVGDVSGKGTPAALFMSVTKYLIEACTTVDTPIDETLEKINKLLAKNNETCMFVTVFLGVLDLKSGDFVYANAGHNSPLIWTQDAPVVFLELVGGPLLGIMDPGLFRVGKTTLVPDGGLLVYTDGVTEAFNVEGEPFSDEKLLRTVERIRGADVKSITEKVLREIDEFCGVVPQSDDITIMALNYKPDHKDSDGLIPERIGTGPMAKI